jgi:hypothetical protein
MSKKAAPKAEKKTAKPAEKSPKATPSDFLKLMKAIVEGNKPRGLKVVKNEVGGYTFNYGSKSAPISIVASESQLASVCLSILELKVAKPS